jgi:lipopolysaccharide/colanic/teichoic acid biosynthesis glycosyltransferase
VAQREYQRIVSPRLQPGKPEQVANDAFKAVSKIARQGSLRRTWSAKQTKKPDTPLVPARTASSDKHFPRRMFDAVCAAGGLAILSPLFAMIAVAIKLDDGGPVLYSHVRIGKGFQEFRLLKFRSMIFSSAGGSTVTAPHDARVTRAGRFLRKYKLDELPQLVNVLRGEMQLVGVRPQMQRFVEMFRGEYEELLQTPPGITDLATLSFRNEERFFHQGSIEEQYITRIMPAKLKLSLKYSRRRTFLSDLEILFRTVLGFQSPSTAWRDASFDQAGLVLPNSFPEILPRVSK